MAARTRRSDDRLVTFKLKGWSRPNTPYNEFKVTPKFKGKTDGHMILVDRKDVRNDHGLEHPARKDRSSLGLNQAWLDPPAGVIIQKDDDFPFWGHRIYEDVQEFNKKSTNKRRVLFYDIRHGEADHNKWKKELGKEWEKESEHRKRPVFVHDGNEYCIIDPPLTGKGEKDAKRAGALFKKLKNHRFPMPATVYISPLYRAVQTFELLLEGDFGIKIEKCRVVPCLREQRTGNCADILMKEFLSGDKRPPPSDSRPPPPGSGEIRDWMEVEDEKAHGKKTNSTTKLEERVGEFFKILPRFDDSDCIARVTHSLLNRHTLRSLQVGDVKDGATVMKRFMLDEGGVFAYVFELDKVNNLEKQFPRDWPKYSDYVKDNSLVPRLPTAFLGAIPCKVNIDSKIKTIADLIHEGNSEHKRSIGNKQNVESQTKVDTGKVISRETNIAREDNDDGGNRVVTNKTVQSTMNVDGSNHLARRKKVPIRQKTGVNKNAGSKSITATPRVVDGRRNISSKRTTGAKRNAESAGKLAATKMFAVALTASRPIRAEHARVV